MKKYFNRSGLAVLAASAFLTACDPEIDAPEISRGDADFTRYVSLGNSLTAGFADGALYRAGQEVAYPNILAQQFKLAGGGEFRQPLVPVTGGDYGVGAPIIQSPTNITFPSRLVLGTSTDCRGVNTLGPIRAAATGEASILLSNRIGNQGPYNNLGVPGALSFHLLAPEYGSSDLNKILNGQANPFFSRFASSNSTSIIQDAMAQNPTFFTLWIGNNDVLGYALSGGSGSPTSIQGPPGIGFDGTMNALLTTLTSKGAKGAVANIPDITLAPYFNTVPYNGLVLSDTTQALALTQAYAPLGIKFRVGPNPFIIKDRNAPGGKRQIKPMEKILLSISQDSIKCYGLGSQIAISQNNVLTDVELIEIQRAVNGYNQVIRSLADSKNLALVDVYQKLQDLRFGLTENQVTYNNTFVSGNVFSLDGLHFAPRGNAIVANEFIRAINKKYNAKLPTVNVNAYNAVLFP